MAKRPVVYCYESREMSLRERERERERDPSSDGDTATAWADPRGGGARGAVAPLLAP